MAKKQEEPKKYIAYKAFDFKGQFDFAAKHYEPGDEFVLPEHMSRDDVYDKFRNVNKRRDNDKPRGLSFIEIGAVISSDPKEKNNPNAERYTYRHVLPVKEE